MTSWTRVALLTMILCLSLWEGAQARAPRCESLFLPTLSEVIEKLDQENNNFLLKGETVEQFSKDYSRWRRRKIRKLIVDFEFQSIASEKAIERYAIELGEALFGKRELVDRWIGKNANSRLEDSTLLLIKENLLQKGLVKTWGETHDPARDSLYRRSLDKIWNLQHSRVLEWMRLPWLIPSMKDREISQDLMFKIIRDGFQVHAEEARVALKAQTRIEAYNTFRRIYNATFMGFALIFNLHTAYQNMEHYHDQQVAEVINNLQRTQKNVESTVNDIKKEQFEQAYKSAESDFIKKWGEAPTAEESQILKKKIAEALHYRLE